MARDESEVARRPLRVPLRVPSLPAEWRAEPAASGRQLSAACDVRLWRNQQKVYDALLALQRDYPNGQPGALGAALPPLAEAAARLRAELLPANRRWLARLITQRLVGEM